MVVHNSIFIVVTFVFVPIAASLSQKEYPFLKTQINDEKHAVAFNKLLNSVVKINQKRLDAIKKLNKLQATDLYPTLEETLRLETTRRDSYESESESDENIIYLVIPDTPVPNAEDRASTAPRNGQNSSNSIDPARASQPEPKQNGILTEQAKLETLLPQNNRAHDDSKIRGPTALNRNSSINESQISISRDGLYALRQNIERSCRSKEVKKCKRACRAATKSACDVYDCKRKLKKKLKKECKRECKEEYKSNW